MNEQLLSVLKRIERAIGAVESESWDNSDLLDELKDILEENYNNIDYSITGLNKNTSHSSIETTSRYIK